MSKSKDELHVIAAQYADREVEQANAQRKECRLLELDSYAKQVKWLTAYEGFVAGFSVANQLIDSMLLASNPGGFKGMGKRTQEVEEKDNGKL